MATKQGYRFESLSMSDMSVQEFAEKLVNDKMFRRVVAGLSYDAKPPKGDEHGMGLWLNAGAAKMGYDFDPVELQEELTVRLKKLSVFKKIAFGGSLINAASKAKKAAGLGKG